MCKEIELLLGIKLLATALHELNKIEEILRYTAVELSKNTLVLLHGVNRHQVYPIIVGSQPRAMRMQVIDFVKFFSLLILLVADPIIERTGGCTVVDL